MSRPAFELAFFVYYQGGQKFGWSNDGLDRKTGIHGGFVSCVCNWCALSLSSSVIVRNKKGMDAMPCPLSSGQTRLSTRSFCHITRTSFPSLTQLASKSKVICHYTNKNDSSESAKRIVPEVVPERPSDQGDSDTRSKQ